MIQVEAVFFIKTYIFIITAKNLILSFLTFVGFQIKKNQLNFVSLAVFFTRPLTNNYFSPSRLFDSLPLWT